jgi:hypothetical protein
MRRNLTTLRAKGGESQNGCSRQLMDEAAYREHANFLAIGGGSPAYHQVYDTAYSGWSNASRPKDYAISLRSKLPVNETVGVVS